MKDWSDDPQKGYRVLLGEGIGKWNEIIEAAETVAGVEYYLVEQEGSRFPPLDTAKRCLQNLKRMRGEGAAPASDALRVEKTDPVGRKIENEYFIADLSHRTIQGKEEDSGTLRSLTYKEFGLTLLRTRNRMHWAPNLQRQGVQGYKGIGTWHPVQTFRDEERKGERYIHFREGYLADYPEVKIEAEYRFLAGVPYFLFWSRMTVEKPLVVTLLRYGYGFVMLEHKAQPDREPGHGHLRWC